MKILVLIAAVYLGYRFLRHWMGHGTITNRKYSGHRNREIDDLMVKDPVCEVYIPKNEGIRLLVDGQEYYFCSSKCRDTFLENRRRH